MTSIGNSIANRRIELGFSQQEVADSIGTSQASLSRWEAGKQDVTVSFLRLLAETLQTKMAVLLGEK